MARMIATKTKSKTPLSVMLAKSLTKALNQRGYGAGSALAKATGLDPSQISAFKEGKGNPTLRTVDLIANALEMDSLEFLELYS